MRRPPRTILLALLLAAFAWPLFRSGGLVEKHTRAIPGATAAGREGAARAGTVPAAEVAAASPQRLEPWIAVKEHGLPRGAAQRAFRFVLDGDALVLEATEEIGGEFRPRRGPAGWQAGMLCCRLLDSRRQVIAEEAVPAPDLVCVVLEPHLPDADGAPQPVRMTTKGPAVFQVRMPRLESATEMKVWRITATREDGAAEGKLLASVPLAR